MYFDVEFNDRAENYAVVKELVEMFEREGYSAEQMHTIFGIAQHIVLNKLAENCVLYNEHFHPDNDTQNNDEEGGTTET